MTIDVPSEVPVVPGVSVAGKNLSRDCINSEMEMGAGGENRE